MGVTDYGRGNKAITCRALGRRTRDSLFSWGGAKDGWVFFRGAGIADDIQPRKNTQPVSGGRVMGVANFTLMIWKKS
ncbi:hypothetical protein DW159_09180 [Coprococcus sp. AM14-16]|nr:hypothetical protein DW159_09180 [Coprococcus sp. AM14-16]